MPRAIPPVNQHARARPNWYWLLGLLLVLAGIASGALTTARAQDADPTVFVVQIRNDIDLGLAPYLARVLEEAEQAGAQAVILEIDTPGGRVDAVLQMREAILASPIRTIAFVNRQAFSAGALLAIAADETYLAPAAVLGAALPVTGTGEPAGEKAISAIGTTFKATAELRGRDPRIAEAMVDPEVEIEGLVNRGQLLTLTTTEALRWGYADGVASNRRDLLQAAGLSGAVVRETSPALAENVVRFLTHPLVASLLISFAFLLVLLDLSSGGIGIVSAGGLGLLAIFFWGHMLAGLAGWEGILLVLLGLVLIGVEVLIIPGFGVAGILGLLALLAGLFISLIGTEVVTSDDLVRAGVTLAGAVLALLIGSVVSLWLLKATGFRGLVLQAQLSIPDGRPHQKRRGWSRARQPSPEEATRPDARQASVERAPVEQAPVEQAPLTGARGVALSDLRPGGFARIAGQRVDVVTQGDYISAGEPIEVIADEGYRRVVRRSERDAAGGVQE